MSDVRGAWVYFENIISFVSDFLLVSTNHTEAALKTRCSEPGGTTSTAPKICMPFILLIYIFITVTSEIFKAFLFHDYSLYSDYKIINNLRYVFLFLAVGQNLKMLKNGKMLSLCVMRI